MLNKSVITFLLLATTECQFEVPELIFSGGKQAKSRLSSSILPT